MAAIKLDGKIDDWLALEPIWEDPEGDGADAKIAGSDIIKGYMARDEKYYYWCFVFADKKRPDTSVSIQRDLYINILPTKAGYQVTHIQFGCKFDTSYLTHASCKAGSTTYITHKSTEGVLNSRTGEGILEVRADRKLFTEYLAEGVAYEAFFNVYIDKNRMEETQLQKLVFY